MTVTLSLSHLIMMGILMMVSVVVVDVDVLVRAGVVSMALLVSSVMVGGNWSGHMMNGSSMGETSVSVSERVSVSMMANGGSVMDWSGMVDGNVLDGSSCVMMSRGQMVVLVLVRSSGRVVLVVVVAIVSVGQLVDGAVVRLVIMMVLNLSYVVDGSGSNNRSSLVMMMVDLLMMNSM